MATGLCNNYNMFDEIGNLGGTATTNELNLQRAQAIKDWFDTNYSDIFETVVVDNTAYNEVFIDCYFKGMTSGIYIQVGVSTSVNVNRMGIIRNGSRTSITNAYFYNGEVNLFVAKSKYGFITGFYKTNKSEVRAFVINRNTSLVALFLGNSSINSLVSVIQGTNESTYTEYARGNNGEVALVQDNIPYTDFVADGVYKSVGAGVTNLAEYRIANGSNYYCEVIGYGNTNNLRSYALLLEEATTEDYANIPARLTEEE